MAEKTRDWFVRYRGKDGKFHYTTPTTEEKARSKFTFIGEKYPARLLHHKGFFAEVATMNHKEEDAMKGAV
jgi:hypothetical protein